MRIETSIAYQSNIIIRIEETVRSRWSYDIDATDEDMADVHTNYYLVSTRIMRTWMETNVSAFRYIRNVIDAALNGDKHFEASVKFSFYDAPEWYTDLIPDRDCDDPIVDFHYTVIK